MLSAISRPGEGFVGLSELGSRPSEMTSPKRDVLFMCDVLRIF